MKPYRFCIIIIVSAFSSCWSGNDSDIKKALNELVKSYPELYGNGLLEKYKPVRKLYDNIDSVEMQLLETEHSDQQIVILSNTKGQIYPVPFPDNNYRKYWRFYGESLGKASTDKTFSAQMNKAFKILSINDDWKVGKVFNEMMVSLIQSRAVFPVDSATFREVFEKSFLQDSCKAISKNNFQAIFSDFEISGSYLDTFWDFGHDRFFKFQGVRMDSGKKYYKIIVCREPCVDNRLYL